MLVSYAECKIRRPPKRKEKLARAGFDNMTAYIGVPLSTYHRANAH
jgi:hypothetical protein